MPFLLGCSFTFEGALAVAGDPVEVRDGEVPVFWACGMTAQAAVAALPFAIGHLPGHMAIIDRRDDHYRVI